MTRTAMHARDGAASRAPDAHLVKLQMLIAEIWGEPEADAVRTRELAGEYRGVRWVARGVPRRFSPGLPQWWVLFGGGAARLRHATARDAEAQVRAWVEAWADAHPEQWHWTRRALAP